MTDVSFRFILLFTFKLLFAQQFRELGILEMLA